jgi:hypothetical protein
MQVLYFPPEDPNLKSYLKLNFLSKSGVRPGGIGELLDGSLGCCGGELLCGASLGDEASLESFEAPGGLKNFSKPFGGFSENCNFH